MEGKKLKVKCQVPVLNDKNGKKHAIMFPSTLNNYDSCNQDHFEFDCPFFKEYLKIICFRCKGAGHSWNTCNKLSQVLPTKEMIDEFIEYNELTLKK